MAYHENIVKPIILDAVFRSESIAEGGGDICLNVFLENFEKYLGIKEFKNLEEVIGLIDEEFKKESSDLSRSVLKFRKSHLDTIISETFSSTTQRKIAKKITEVSNHNSKIIIEKSEREETVIRLKKGFTFKIKSAGDKFLNNESWSRSNVKSLIIDGMIEEVSEIHHLLESASETKDPYAIFVRNASDDVKNTIAVNNARKTIDVALIEVGFDENTLNILNDISICCDAKIVSSNFGDLISKSCQEDIVEVKKISILGSDVSIQNDPSPEKLRSHIRYLSTKKNNIRNQEISHLFDQRIRSLNSDKAT